MPLYPPPPPLRLPPLLILAGRRPSVFHGLHQNVLRTCFLVLIVANGAGVTGAPTAQHGAGGKSPALKGKPTPTPPTPSHSAVIYIRCKCRKEVENLFFFSLVLKNIFSGINIEWAPSRTCWTPAAGQSKHCC